MALPSLDFVRRLFAGSASEETTRPLLQLFTPQVVGTDKPAVRFLVGGLTVIGIAVAGTLAVGSLAILFAALAALYFLATEILGLQLDVDPRAFVAEAQKYAARTSN
ncbi:MAG: hypothetical protein ABI321_19345 [Polyangia bacterium]